ncbi:uncharacterized protein LOC134260773 isoform X3 [Saccostrea cucullata]|uniref:uncharacterized protein LOC134260773 isoform X3 n=1 Tax=Saccostrea cuccullata TaxID=36930 RepID=UPI002ED4020F
MGLFFRHLILIYYLYIHKSDCIMLDDSSPTDNVDITFLLRRIADFGYNAFKRPVEVKNSRSFPGAKYLNYNECFLNKITPAMQIADTKWKAGIVWEVIFPNIINKELSQMDDRRLLCIKVVNEQIFRGKTLKASVIDILIYFCEKSETLSYTAFRRDNGLSSQYNPKHLYYKRFHALERQSNEYSSKNAVDHTFALSLPKEFHKLLIISINDFLQKYRQRNETFTTNYKRDSNMWKQGFTNHSGSEKHNTGEEISWMYLMNDQRGEWIADYVFFTPIMSVVNYLQYNWQSKTNTSSRREKLLSSSNGTECFDFSSDVFKFWWIKPVSFKKLLQKYCNNNRNFTNLKNRRFSMENLTNVSLLLATRGGRMYEFTDIKKEDIYFIAYHDEIETNMTSGNKFSWVKELITIFLLVVFLSSTKNEMDKHEYIEGVKKQMITIKNYKHWIPRWKYKQKPRRDLYDAKLNKIYQNKVLIKCNLLRTMASNKPLYIGKKTSSERSTFSLEKKYQYSRQQKYSKCIDNTTFPANETTCIQESELHTKSMFYRDERKENINTVKCQENQIISETSINPCTSFNYENTCEKYSSNDCAKTELKSADKELVNPNVQNQNTCLHEMLISQLNENANGNHIHENHVLLSNYQSDSFEYQDEKRSLRSNMPSRGQDTRHRFSLPNTNPERKLIGFPLPESSHGFSKTPNSRPFGKRNVSISFQTEPLKEQISIKEKMKTKKETKRINTTEYPVPSPNETEETTLKAVEGHSMQCSETEDTYPHKVLCSTDLGISPRPKEMPDCSENETNVKMNSLVKNSKSEDDSLLLSFSVENSDSSQENQNAGFHCYMSHNSCPVTCESLATSQSSLESKSYMTTSFDSKPELEHPSSEFPIDQTDIMNVKVYGCQTHNSNRIPSASKKGKPSKPCLLKQCLHEEKNIKEKNMIMRSGKNLYSLLFDIVKGYFKSLRKRKRRVARRKIRKVIREVLRWRHVKRFHHPKYNNVRPVINQEEEESFGTLSSLFNDISLHSMPIVESYRHEWSRLASFHDFVSQDVHATVLARHGWYSTGNESTTACFSCHIVRQGWIRGDDPRDFHDPNCRFISNSSNNIPIQRQRDAIHQATDYDNYTDTAESDFVIAEQGRNDHISNELSSFSSNASSVYHMQYERDKDSQQSRTEMNFPTERFHNQSSTTRRNQNEYHQSVSTETKATAASCIRPAITQERASYSPMTPHSTTENTAQTATVPITQATASSTPSRETQLEALMRDPMGINFDRPKYPSYAILAVRISSFADWPTAMTQTPRDMALAGFFYAGHGDYTRCFFCGGGLRNWEAGDDPWVEHARWFSKCAFVRQNRGQQFIDLVLRRAAEMEQHSLPNASQEKNIDDEKRSKEEKIMNSAAVKSIKDMGYNDEEIKAAITTIKSRLPRGKHKVSAQEILEVIFELSDNQRTESMLRSQIVETATLPEDLPTNTSEQSSERSVSNEVEGATSEDQKNSVPINDVESLKRENSSLKDQIQCKICMEGTVSVAFLPCGHLACCADCAPAMRKCPICREFVRGTVKTYLV